MPSSFKGWKEKWFYVMPQDLDLSFSPWWGLQDTAVTRDRQMLENLEPLVYDINDILDRAHNKGIEGRTCTFIIFLNRSMCFGIVLVLMTIDYTEMMFDPFALR